jgi:riboflavin kinase/FMN adenylyltransferase
LFFCCKLRDEIRFQDVAALRQQIGIDLQTARNYFDGHADQGIPLAHTMLSL